VVKKPVQKEVENLQLKLSHTCEASELKLTIKYVVKYELIREYKNLYFYNYIWNSSATLLS
jgi:hypothetical protein